MPDTNNTSDTDTGAEAKAEVVDARAAFAAELADPDLYEGLTFTHIEIVENDSTEKLLELDPDVELDVIHVGVVLTDKGTIGVAFSGGYEVFMTPAEAERLALALLNAFNKVKV
jgi:hypothetical protein